MGGRWWRCIIGECNCRLLDAVTKMAREMYEGSCLGEMAELVCLTTETMWLEVRWHAKCCVLQ